MFNKNLLRAKLVEENITVETLCKHIGITIPTYYRKIQRNGDFSREEILLIAKTLRLSREDRDSIFFAQKLA